MKVKRKPMSLHNLLYIRKEAKIGKWYGIALALREFVIQNDLYPTGPIVYQIEPKDKDNAVYIVYLPVNQAVEVSEGSAVMFRETLAFEDGLMFRHLDIDDPLIGSHTLLKACALENKLELEEPYYNIFLDVYGDGVIDIYAPIKRGS